MLHVFLVLPFVSVKEHFYLWQPKMAQDSVHLGEGKPTEFSSIYTLAFVSPD